MAPSFLTRNSLGLATFLGGGKNLHSSTMYSPSEIRGEDGSLFSIPSTNWSRLKDTESFSVESPLE